MKTTTIPVGMLQTNCYIVENDEKQCIIVDPGNKAERIIAFIEQEWLTPKAIFLTHGHYDHVGAVDALVQHFHLPVAMAQEDYALINNPKNNVRFNGKEYVASEVHFVQEGKQDFYGFPVTFWHAPGHSEGCMMMEYANQLFSGDVLFLEDVGRVDLETSDPRKMKDSLRYIASFEPSLIVYPGHDKSTTIAHELQFNPYLRTK